MSFGSITNDFLDEAYCVMATLCCAANRGNFSLDASASRSTYLAILCAVSYRLFDVKFDRSSSLLNETLRLGLIIFAMSISVMWQALQMCRTPLSADFRQCLMHLRSAPPDSPLMLWLYVVGLASTSGGHAPEWLIDEVRSRVKSHGISTRAALRERLRSVLWIDAIHDIMLEHVDASLDALYIS